MPANKNVKINQNNSTTSNRATFMQSQLLVHVHHFSSQTAELKDNSFKLPNKGHLFFPRDGKDFLKNLWSKNYETRDLKKC